MSKFDDADSLGSLPRAKIGDYLLAIGDVTEAGHFQPGAVEVQGIFGKKPYEHTGCILGYIPEVTDKATSISAIQGTSKIAGDKSLIGKRIKISLDKFYVHQYPGLGQHTILCEFSGKNQVSNEAEELRFALQLVCNDKAAAAISGAPIFMGVTVGADGISFEGRTVNVSSKGNEALLSAFETPAFKNGLSLLSTAQPALKPFSELTTSVVKSIAGASKNMQMHKFNLGLDFGDGASSTRLRTGSFIIAQSDESKWSWDDYQWNQDSQMLEFKHDNQQAIEFNYLVIGVSNFS